MQYFGEQSRLIATQQSLPTVGKLALRCKSTIHVKRHQVTVESVQYVDEAFSLYGQLRGDWLPSRFRKPSLCEFVGGVVKEMGSSVKSSDLEMRGCATAIPLLPPTLRHSFSNSINHRNIRQRPALRLRIKRPSQQSFYDKRINRCQSSGLAAHR
ncbi:predicted protein [Aspergillus nidulans FGSC A4]|uniref:Uncharacterized protein n=1 Tax=Emericella nidulans (strain FGSC A4 / ATCC 38163 / CBS 112.46 / NRRL 194 / M139) TaxID=227321 RepID=Q5ASM2_EMENI|nr:hypothetical protein [Aspergillus nidulans FGSC A4]EAA60257.1 predicted protein [Aspergillus nidulans FGSC A4]CBF78191.1 TPA: hypothetical protein ANIA_08708 [Aspergillus nidulans FGSC A4]|eukprot:XP_681977.1 predicted protein [Aspergillus nidulans FGSC A4]